MRKARKVGVGDPAAGQRDPIGGDESGVAFGEAARGSALPCLPQGPLRSMVEDLQSEESDEDDSSSGEETTVKANPGRESR